MTSEKERPNTKTQAFSIGEGPAAFVISSEVFPLIVRELGMSLAVSLTSLLLERIGLTLPVGILQLFLGIYFELLYSTWNLKSGKDWVVLDCFWVRILRVLHVLLLSECLGS
jgi:hypothetical protein